MPIVLFAAVRSTNLQTRLNVCYGLGRLGDVCKCNNRSHNKTRSLLLNCHTWFYHQSSTAMWRYVLELLPTEESPLFMWCDSTSFPSCSIQLTLVVRTEPTRFPFDFLFIPEEMITARHQETKRPQLLRSAMKRVSKTTSCEITYSLDTSGHISWPYIPELGIEREMDRVLPKCKARPNQKPIEPLTKRTNLLAGA